MKASGGDYDKLLKDFGTSVYPQLRYFVNVIDREEPATIKIFGTNKKFIEALLDASDDPDIGDVTDPQSGHDVVITRTGAGNRTRYKQRIRTKSSPVEFDMKALYQLDKEIDEWINYEEMVKLLKENYGTELREVGLKFAKKKVKNDEEDDSRPVKKNKKKKRVVEEDDDNGHDDEDDDGENKDTEEEEDTESEEDEEIEDDDDVENAEGIEDEDEEED
jgi:hypothetical protein